MTRQTIIVGPRESGQTLAAIVREQLKCAWSKAKSAIAGRQVKVNGAPCPDAARRMRRGERITIVQESAGQRRPAAVRAEKRSPSSAKPRPKPTPTIVYVDDDVVVVDKPPGLTTMRDAEETAEFGARSRRYLPPTLADLLTPLVPGPRLRPVHRIDRDTSGLVVFARTERAEEHLSRQFRAHTVVRRYRAIVRGRAVSGRIESWLVRDRGDGRRGSGPPGTGQRAVTHVEVIGMLGSCTLIECRLETGRTHQIRIHLGEAGTPLAGETVYDRPLHGAPVTDPSGAPRVALHAIRLGFVHPTTNRAVEWESAFPPDLTAMIDRLGKRD